MSIPQVRIHGVNDVRIDTVGMPGISADDVLRFDLPLPERDMAPISIEEQIICYADKFFSKNGNGTLKTQEKNIDQIMRSLQKYGQDKVDKFHNWVEMFGD